MLHHVQPNSDRQHFTWSLSQSSLASTNQSSDQCKSGVMARAKADITNSMYDGASKQLLLPSLGSGRLFPRLHHAVDTGVNIRLHASVVDVVTFAVAYLQQTDSHDTLLQLSAEVCADCTGSCGEVMTLMINRLKKTTSMIQRCQPAKFKKGDKAPE